ncbi:MAG TPA: cyclic pyranopterin monophosphate synthase MoaC [Gemmatimonadaceae bacterium]|nr:cyclic pyranopterin monophosphate synthase MoaC [Gemmatimonadaceae bacterium]
MTEPRRLTHLADDGSARMVDVGAKPETERVARATGVIRMRPETLQAIEAHAVAKGDVLAVARVAGIMAAKRTSELIPLCHPIALTDLQLDLTPEPELPGIRATATARSRGRTGVEMEAICAVAVSLVTIYDMAKGVDKLMVVSDISLLEKSGGRSGHWRRDPQASGGTSVAP